MPNYSDLDPSILRRGLTDGNGNLKPSLTTDHYTGGTPTAANQVKRSIVDAAGNLREGLVYNGGIKRSLTRDILAPAGPSGGIGEMAVGSTFIVG